MRAQACDQGADACGVGAGVARAPVLAAGDEGALEEAGPELAAEAEVVERWQPANHQARVVRDLEGDVAQLEAAAGVEALGLGDDELGLRQQVGELRDHGGIDQAEAKAALAQRGHVGAQGGGLGGPGVGEEGGHDHHVVRGQGGEAGVGQEGVGQVDEGQALAEQLADVGVDQAAHQHLGIDVVDPAAAVADARARGLLQHELVAGDALVAPEHRLAAQEGGAGLARACGRFLGTQRRLALEAAETLRLARRGGRRGRLAAEQPAEQGAEHGCSRRLSGCGGP